MKTKFSILLSIVLAFAAFAGFARSAEAQVKVACVGDSITAGYGLSSTQNYPAQLQTLLGSGYTVGNFGSSGACMQKSVGRSYWKTPAFKNSKSFAPNVVVIMLGTNDAKSGNWNAANYNTDYRAMIAEYQNLPSRPTVYVCLIPPAYNPNLFGDSNVPARVQNEVVPTIRTVASQAGVTLIDNNTPLLNHPEYFPDGIHPNVQGAAIIASTVYGSVTQP